MASRPHAHSHGVRSVTLLLALSFHSIIEGLALGIMGTSEKVFALFLSLILHKVVVAFSIGLQLARTHAHQLKWVIISIVALSLMSPLGAAFGIGVSEMKSELRDIVVLIFEGLAVGTFIYVTFFEVLIHERDNEHNSLLKLLAIVIGFATIAAVRVMGHSHEHGDGASGHIDHHHDYHHSHPESDYATDEYGALAVNDTLFDGLYR